MPEEDRPVNLFRNPIVILTMLLVLSVVALIGAAVIGVDKGVLRSLGTCGWVRAKQNVIVIGATGTGKNYLGAALAEAACRHGYRALRTRVPRLLGGMTQPYPVLT